MFDLHTWIAIAVTVACVPWFARTYLSRLPRDVHLWLISAFLTGFCTMFGGTYGALMNLYLLKLGYGADTIGNLNGAFYVGMALLAAVSGPIIQRIGGVRNAAALGMGLVALGQVLFPLPTLLGSTPSLGWLGSTLMISSCGITLYAVNIWPFMAGRIEPEKRPYGFAGHLGLVPVGGFFGTILSGKISSAISGSADASAEAHAITLACSGVLLLVGVLALVMIPKRPLIASSGAPAVLRPLGPVPVLIIALMVGVMVFDVSGEGIGRVFQNVYMSTGLHMTSESITVSMGYGQLVAAAAVFSTPAGIARFGLAWTFILTTLGMSLGLSVMSHIPTELAAGAGYALLIGFSQMARAAKTQYAMELVEEYYRPHISGFMQFAETSTVFLLSMGGGHLLQYRGLTFPALFDSVALSTALAALWFWLFFVRTPRGALRTA
jgi:hypothetical protein